MPITTVLFDFFGTLVDYRPRVEGDGFERSYRLFRDLGGTARYEEFLLLWEANAAAFEDEANKTHVEYPLEAMVASFLRSQGVAERHTDVFIETFIAEWNAGVSYDERVIEAVRTLAEAYRLAVVTNTHLPWLVPSHIEAMGLATQLPTVVTSIEVGWRKPHPRIFETALDRLVARPTEAVFVGDSLTADFHGARRAGLRPVLVDAAGEHMRAHERVRSVAEIPSLLAGLRER